MISSDNSYENQEMSLLMTYLLWCRPVCHGS